MAFAKTKDIKMPLYAYAFGVGGESVGKMAGGAIGAKL